MIVMIFGVVILPTLIEMPDQLNQHTTSCVLPASLQVWRKKNSETEFRNSLIFEGMSFKGRDAVRRKSSRSTLLRVQVVKPVFWFPGWPPVRVLVLLVELSCPESCYKWAAFSWHMWWWSLSWWKSQWLSWWCWSVLRPVCPTTPLLLALSWHTCDADHFSRPTQVVPVVVGP